jgi:hypothetical protein
MQIAVLAAVPNLAMPRTCHDPCMSSREPDAGELLFAWYASLIGCELVAYHPDLGTSKRPDFLIQAAGHEVVVEVESFGMPPAPIPLRSGFVPGPKLKPVRNKITEGAAQLKGLPTVP